FGVEVDDEEARPGAQRLDFAQHDGKGIVDRQHEDAAHDVDHADRVAGVASREVAAVPRRAGGEVGGTKQARLGADVVERLLLVPDVVARGHHADAPVEELIADLARDAEARRRVLHVGDHQIDGVVLDEGAEPTPDELASRPADDVANEEDAHCGHCRAGKAGGAYPAPALMAIAIVRPRRSGIFGIETRSSPLTSVACARSASQGRSRRTARANRPKPRSIRWKVESRPPRRAVFSPTTRTASAFISTRTAAGSTPGRSTASSTLSSVSNTSIAGE